MTDYRLVTTRLLGQIVAFVEVFVIGLGLLVFAALVWVNAGGLQL